MNQSIAKRNAALYNALNDIDDRREYIITALSSGPHEPSSAFGHYDVEDVDDGGRLIERRERGIGKKFIPVSELPSTLTEASETEQVLDLPDMNGKPLESHSLEQVEEIRFLVWREHQPVVILRRRTALHAI